MAYYFASMAVRLMQILNNEGQSINIRNHIIIHIFLAVVFLSGMLQFSIIQVVNLAATGDLCVDSGFLQFVSIYISLCFNYGPFFVCLYLVRFVYLISRIEADDLSADDDEEEDDENSQIDFTSVNSPNRGASIK